MNDALGIQGTERPDQLSEPIRRLIELNQRGGRIPEGLRAAAAEYSTRGMRKAFLQLADVVEAGGVPAGYRPSDLETLVAATATDGDGKLSQQVLTNQDKEHHDHFNQANSSPLMLGPNLATWGESQRAVRQAIKMIETHLWFAVILVFLGGFTNWLIVWLTQQPFMDLVDEFELHLEYTSLLFFEILTWVGPVVMALAGMGGLVLVMYRLGPFRELAEQAIYCVPFIGKAFRRLHLALMCDGVSRFLAAGMGYPQALRGTALLMRSQVLREWLERASRAVEQGGALVETMKYLPTQGEVLPALVGPVGPSRDQPAVGWYIAGNYFQSAGIRGSGSARVLVPFFSIIGTSLGWMGMTGIFVPMINMISALGGY